MRLVKDNQHRSTASAIMALAVPSIVANITTPLLGLVDMAIVGHMGSEVFIAAIALGGTCFSMIYWVFSFLRMGTGGVTAQAVGAGDRTARDAALLRAMTIALVLGVIIIALRHPVCRGVLWFMDATGVTGELTGRYILVLIWGAPASLGLYVANGWFIGLQNSRMTLVVSLTINVVNIAASLVLVYVMGMGIEGVAAGTLIAQWVGLLVALALTTRFKPRMVALRQIFSAQQMRRFLSINFDIFLRTLCLVAVTVWFTRAGARQGDIILAVNALMMQLFLLFSYIMDGFAYAGEALVGRYTGAGDAHQRRVTIAALFRYGVIVSGVFTVVYVLFGGGVLSVLSDDAGVLAASADYRWWAVTIPFAGMATFIWDGVMIGSTLTRMMLLSMACAMAVFFVTYFALIGLMGNHALWLAFILYLVTRGVLQTILYRRNVSATA